MPVTTDAELGAALKALKVLGFDSETENVRCLIPLERCPAEYEDWLKRLGAGGSPDRQALKGKLLVDLGRSEEALPLLEAAAKGAARLPAKAWLGECLILLGRLDEALRALDDGACDSKTGPWGFFFRAAARLAAGDADGARSDCGKFQAAQPGAAALALRAMLSAQAQRWDQARADLAAAAKAAAAESWPLALLAAASSSAGDLPGAKKALLEALARRPSARLHAELARVNEKLGIIFEAIENAAQAVKLEPCVEYHVLKAHLHDCWREGELAAEEYGKALSFGPDPSLLFMRSRTLASAGRLKEALADGEAALAAVPDDENLAAWRHQLLLYNGREAAAARALAPLLCRKSPFALFAQGYALLRKKRYAQAAREFARCASLIPEGALGRKADFYRRVAEIMAAPAPRRAAKPGFHLLGLGVNPPYSAPAAALRAIAACDVVFNNIMGEESFEFLRPFCPDVRPVAYHQMNDEGILSDRMLAEVRPGRTVGFVTRGNAIVYGPLGTELLRRCRAQGVPWKCVASVCSFDTFSARTGSGPFAQGQFVADSKAIAPGIALDTGSPMTIFVDLWAPEGSYERMCAGLSKAYGRSRTCLVFDHVVDQAPMSREIGALPALRPSLSWSAIVHIPADGE